MEGIKETKKIKVNPEYIKNLIEKECGKVIKNFKTSRFGASGEYD